MLAKSVLLVLTLLCAAVASFADTYAITVGDHDLLPDQAGQTVEIYCSGGGAFEMVDFRLRVGNGTAVPAKPVIESVDLLTGTMFQTNNFGGQDDSLAEPYHITSSVMALSEAACDGLIATVTLDTTGLTAGSWTLALGHTGGGPTELYGLDQNFLPVLLGTTLTDGTITIVPEPLSLGLLGSGMGMLLMRRRRR